MLWGMEIVFVVVFFPIYLAVLSAALYVGRAVAMYFMLKWTMRKRGRETNG